MEQDDYDKENDITGDATEPYTPERSPIPHRSPTTQIATHATVRNREPPSPLSRRDHKDKDEDSYGDNGFDSMDEFVVSDNDEPSYHETSDSETEIEKPPTPVQPPKSGRKRLMRGRKPDVGSTVNSGKNSPSEFAFDLEPKVPETIKSPTKSRHSTKRLSHDHIDLSTQFKTLEIDDDNGPVSQLETDLAQ